MGELGQEAERGTKARPFGVYMSLYGDGEATEAEYLEELRSLVDSPVFDPAHPLRGVEVGSRVGALFSFKERDALGWRRAGINKEAVARASGIRPTTMRAYLAPIGSNQHRCMSAAAFSSLVCGCAALLETADERTRGARRHVPASRRMSVACDLLRVGNPHTRDLEERKAAARRRRAAVSSLATIGAALDDEALSALLQTALCMLNGCFFEDEGACWEPRIDSGDLCEPVRDGLEVNGCFEDGTLQVTPRAFREVVQKAVRSGDLQALADLRRILPPDC